MNCVGCSQEIENGSYGYLHYWDNKDGTLKQGYWHSECFSSYKFPKEILFWRIRKVLGLL